MNAEEGAGRRRRSIRRGKGPGPGRGSGKGRGVGQERGAGRGAGRGPRSGADETSLRTASRRLVVATLAVIADDVRDADGLVRPALRRAADRLGASRIRPVGKLGAAYLRLDSPAVTAGEAGAGAEAIGVGALESDVEIIEAEAVEFPNDGETDDETRPGAG